MTKKCKCVSQCEQRPNEHLEDANDLMDEGLHGFGLAESAKIMDTWSSLGFEGTSIFLMGIFLCCLLFASDELCFGFFME